MLRRAKVGFRIRKRPANNEIINNTTIVQASEVDTPGTTQFVNDALSRVAVRTNVEGLPSSLLDATKTGISDDIHTFLAKPLLLSSGTWNTQIANDILTSVQTPTDLLAYDIFQQKVKGFLGFKATTIIKLQVNATKFQQGRLLMVFIPQGGVVGSYPGMRLRSLMAVTQLPRIEMDVSCDTEITMEIPYVSPSPYYNLVTEDNPVGKLYVVVYSPLLSGPSGADHVDYTLWGSFKDVEMVTPVFKPEMGRPGKAPAVAESDAIGSNSLSSTLAGGAAVAKMFMGVPMLSNLMGPTNWFISAASKTASAFGYSKPSSEDAVTKMYNVEQFNMVNADGVDVAPKLAMASDHAVGALSGYGGSTLDEMAVSHIVSIPAYYTALTWNSSQAGGINLWTTLVEPHKFAIEGTKVGTGGTYTWRDSTPVAYIGKHFALWRGSFVFTFKIVKTGFHSGRLLFYFNPTGINPVLSLADTQYCYREILDVREKSEWTFTVPYASTRQYHRSAYTNYNISSDEDPLGRVGLIVLNDLVRPETASESVQILIEVSGGPDFEYAAPRDARVIPFVDETWAAQMGEVVESTAQGTVDCTQCNVVVGNGMVESPTLDPAFYCIGERVLSLLQLMKRYSYMRFGGDYSVLSQDGYAIRPYSVWYQRSSSTLIPDGVGPISDPLCSISPMYAYSRGSVRIGFVPKSVGDDLDLAPWVASSFLSYNSKIVDNVPNPVQDNEASYFFPPGSRNMKFYQVPNYLPNHCRLVRPNSSDYTDTIDQFSSLVKTAVAQIPARTTKIIFMRSVGEDFNLAYFVGTPRTIFNAL